MISEEIFDESVFQGISSPAVEFPRGSGFPRSPPPVHPCTPGGPAPGAVPGDGDRRVPGDLHLCPVHLLLPQGRLSGASGAGGQNPLTHAHGAERTPGGRAGPPVRYEIIDIRARAVYPPRG